MKLILLVFHADNEEILHEILESRVGAGFTTWGPVYGKGRHSDPRMGTQIWPGENQMLIVALNDEEAETLRDALRKLGETPQGEGIKAFDLSATQWL